MDMVNPKTGEVIDSPRDDVKALIELRKITTGESNLAACLSDNRKQFALSLYNQWKFRALSTTQMWWVHKIVLEAESAAARPQQQAAPLGADFQKVIDLFDHAKSALRRPKIRFALPDIGEVRLTVSGSQSRYPGTINVTDNGPFGNNVWYGRVTKEGGFAANPRCSARDIELVTRFLRLLGKNPALLAATYGRQTGNCCFCGLELTDPRSVYVGYGPICAEHYSLPWGEQHASVDESDLAEIESLLQLEATPA